MTKPSRGHLSVETPGDNELGAFLEGAQQCAVEGPDETWSKRNEFAWHLDDLYTGLRTAGNRVGDPEAQRITIAILDMGHDPGHARLPLHLNLDRAINLTGEGDRHAATDPAASPTLEGLRNPGHGTATLTPLPGRCITGSAGFEIGSSS